MTDEQLDKPFSLSEINQAALSLSALVDTLSLDQGLGELAKLQRSRATFWLTASTHVREGKKLSGFLSAYWPTMYATPVAIAEHSGRLSRVLEGLASTAEMQLEIQALMRKLLYPVGMILLGIAVNIFMLLAVIPALNMGGGRRPSGAMQLSMKVHDFVVGHPLILVVMATGIAFGLYRLVIRPDVSSSLIAKVDDLPVLSGTIRSLYFGLWCRYISLMQECSIPLQDALQLSEPLLLPYMTPSIEAVRLNARHGFRNAVDVDNLPEADPRQKLPTLVCNAFRLTENTGNGRRHFENAGKPLIKLGMDQIKRFTSFSNNAATIIAAVIAVAPMGLYFMQMIDLISNASR